MFQFLLNGLCEGASLVPLALGFGLILYAGRVFHVAHGAIAIASGYACFFLADGAGAPLILAMPTAILVAAALGMLVEYFVYRPIRGEGERIAVASSTLIIASLGVHVVLTNALALRFGSGSICLCPEAKRTIELGTAVITVVQGAQLAVGLLVACTVWLVLRLTTLGRAFRASASDPELLEVRGYDTRRLRLSAFGLGSSLAAISAVMTVLDVGIKPSSGFDVMLFAAVAAILGGTGKFLAPAFGAILLATLQSLVVWKTSSGWKDAVVFAVLLLLLLLRPRGLLGNAQRAEESWTARFIFR